MRPRTIAKADTKNKILASLLEKKKAIGGRRRAW